MSFRGGGRTPLFAMHGRRVAPRAFPSQRQAFLGIHPIKALFADLPAFSVEQDQQPAIPEPYACLRELAHPLPQCRQRILSARIVDR